MNKLVSRQKALARRQPPLCACDATSMDQGPLQSFSLRMPATAILSASVREGKLHRKLAAW